jgi:flagellar assembly protein FliH
MSSRFRTLLRNIPPPAGSKAGNAYTRFIPREELGDVAQWAPGTLDGSGDGFAPLHRPQAGAAAPAPAPAADAPAAAPAAPAPPTAQEWEARVAAARQSGYQDGYRDGLVALDGFKQSFAAQATAQVGALVEAFDQQFQALDQRIAEALTRCAVELARQVLRQELRTHPDHVARLAAEAVGAVMVSARHVTVRVHPQDLALVAEGAEEALQARGARLMADPAVERGGVLVESDVGSIDARLATRWAQAAAAFGSSTPWTPAGATLAQPAPTRAGGLGDGDADDLDDDPLPPRRGPRA